MVWGGGEGEGESEAGVRAEVRRGGVRVVWELIQFDSAAHSCIHCLPVLPVLFSQQSEDIFCMLLNILSKIGIWNSHVREREEKATNVSHILYLLWYEHAFCVLNCFRGRS